MYYGCGIPVGWKHMEGWGGGGEGTKEVRIISAYVLKQHVSGGISRYSILQYF